VANTALRYLDRAGNISRLLHFILRNDDNSKQYSSIMAAVPVATVLAEAGLAAALAPLMPLIGGTAVLGIVSWKLVAWWKASTAAAAVAAAAAKAAAVEAAAMAAVAAEVAAAEAAAEAAVAEVVGVAVTLSTPVLLVGGVVVLAVIGGVYYQVSKLKRWLCAKYLYLLLSILGIRKRSVIRP
jgi:hypothetical protein